jgi:hypothetical protein
MLNTDIKQNMKSTLLRYIRSAIWLIFSIIICLGCSSTDVLRDDVCEPLPASTPLGRERQSRGVNRAERLFRHVLQEQPQALFQYTRLVDAFKKRADPHGVPFIPFATSRVIGDPLSLESLTHTLVYYDSLYPVKNRRPEGYISPEMVPRAFVYCAAEQLDVDQTIIRKTFQETTSYRGDKPLKFISLVDRLIAGVTDSNRLIERAFSSISPDDRRRLLHMFPKLPNEFIMSNHISETDAIFMLDFAKKVDMAELFAGFSVLSTLLSPEFLAQLKQESADTHDRPLDREIYPGLKGRFLAVRETPAGLLLIGDEGPNIYGVDASVIIDLGGDDIYLNNAGSPVYETKDGHVESIDSHSSVIIDFAGNDRYLNSKFATIASGFFGVGLIVDMEGDDFYSGDRISLGASFFGVGCLIDMAGNDTYACQEMGQGSAFFGCALLLDMAGDDLYEGAKYVQGFGGPLGFGQLLDLKGDDFYRAGWKHGSSYGTANMYQACSQGAAWGFRGYAGGGIGILYDLLGDDFYQAGNFSQGTGYYFGFGMLRDDGGDDEYRGGRYCQGSAAHRAVGAFVDVSGDDIYSGRIAANQGGAWDLSVAGFFDYAGNDSYRGTELSMGSGAQNGLGFFYDGGGKDRYRGNKKSFGYSGDHSYGGGRNAGNLGVFIDTGGCFDTYPVGPFANDKFIIRGDTGVFLDE